MTIHEHNNCLLLHISIRQLNTMQSYSWQTENLTIIHFLKKQTGMQSDREKHTLSFCFHWPVVPRILQLRPFWDNPSEIFFTDFLTPN